ncbi:uncharacterized protein LOC110733723 [Chenopodium quinoa]|uniref:uncharacterized protein LOC110733723 n=1 Tax=Chenopodium quinoa TaxID=63459 RepID=UPI000B79A5B6|nr:uncharacterized protein LOC110733723 [Chenopodium quinoa]
MAGVSGAGGSGGDGGGKIKVDMAYHLGSSDGPGNIITPVQLRGENYDEWARAIRTSLKAKRKYGFVDGSIKKDSDKLDDWEAIHSMLVSWITNTLDPSVRATIGEYDDAHLLWNNLKSLFCVVSGTRICQLKMSLGDCKQGKTDSVAAYFGRIAKIWDELHTYITVPSCSCGACTCNIVAQVEKLRQEDFLHQFLIGLDDPYGLIRGQLLARDPLPSVDKAYQQVIQAERLRGGEVRESLVAFKLQHDTTAKPQRSTSGSDKLCNHCNRARHDETDCYQLNGYPPWWGDRPLGGRGRGRGDSASGRGGGRAGGRGAAGQQVRANKTVGQSSSNSTQGGGATANDGAALAGVSSTQIQQLIDHLNSMKPKLQGKDELGWIVDTGASNHVTCDLTLMTNVVNVQHCPVGLPDGKSAYASKIGTVILQGGLKINNVLFVPQLNCNLISATQLCDELNCTLQFTNKICVIQDLMTRKVIGAGERVDGLYYFRGVPEVKALKIDGVQSTELWHQRMGHPSEKVLQHLPVVSSSTRSSKNKSCDVCPRAKQHRSSFPISNNKASRIFELIHIDLWGPYKTQSTCGSDTMLNQAQIIDNTFCVFSLITMASIQVYIILG